ncbi:MAG TPA: BrnT family toxin [Treponemataceae bacterium]|nr:BrnT family toxin [Treponemataceae bacterium]
MIFEWDENKNRINIQKHGTSFQEVQEAFMDPKRIIIKDGKHSTVEERFFCLGKTENGIATVRFTMRNNNIRIIGAGYWREGKERYEEENDIH